MAAVAALVASSRLVTVTGSSGMGKTRLAVEIAARIEGDYPNGAWLVELAPVGHADLVPQAVAAALGLDPEPGLDPTDAVVAHLADADALVVLDNCEHLLGAAAALAERLLRDCAGVRVLATSQQLLGVPGERTTSLRPLTLPGPADGMSPEQALESEAVALFCARAAASNPAFSLTDEVLPAVGEICGRLDGIPLAIELAAARISVLGPADIAERLGDRFRLLTGGSAMAEPRHQTLAAALGWSYDLLTSEEATLLRRMSVFAGGATLHAVEDICTGDGVPRRDAVDLLTSLVAKSLVIADTTRPRARYRLLETVRAYGHERLEETEEIEAVRTRHAAWCVTQVERAWHQVGVGNERYWVAALEADHDNLRAALEWAIGARSAVALRLAGALTLFWKTRGYLREGQDWLRRALDAVPGAPPPARARALYGLGMLSIMRGDVAAARAAVEESLAVARTARLRRAEAQALNLLGFISIFAQDPLAAKPVLEESVAMARADGDVGSLISSLSLYGRAHLLLGDVNEARRVFQECFDLADETGETPSAALIGLGWTTLGAGEWRRSEELFRRALTIVRHAGNRFETALVLSFLGHLAWARGKPADATALLEEGRSLSLVMGAPFPLSRCLYGLAQVALAEGDPARAAGLADEACAVAEKARLPYALVRALLVRGDVRRAKGDTEAARAAYDEALALARAHSDSVGVATALTRQARLARQRGADDEALTWLSDAIALQASAGDGGVVSSLEAMAGLATDQGRLPVAAGLFAAAVTMRAASGSVRTPGELADYEADVGRLRAAMTPVDLEAASAQGAAMSREEAVALALRGRGARDRPTHGWASLSPTERQIVDLVAEGLTNREIGNRLFISDRTVQGHLSRVFPKLGVTSRREVREALRQR
jgi:predicted ATPase/DNA-binding CsgD family transcriptional regulator